MNTNQSSGSYQSALSSFLKERSHINHFIKRAKEVKPGYFQLEVKENGHWSILCMDEGTTYKGNGILLTIGGERKGFAERLRNELNSKIPTWTDEARKRMPSNLAHSFVPIWINEFRSQAHEIAAPMQDNGKRAKARILKTEDWNRAALAANQALGIKQA